MNILRQHKSLEDMIRKEVPGVPNPRQSAAAIIRESGQAQSMVLFRDRQNHWIVLGVGPECRLHSLGEAARARVDRKTPVAYCLIS